jgi:DNA-binding NarL/FixJ family response regulator
MEDLSGSSNARAGRRILVADGDPIARSALRLVLSQKYGVHAVRDASDAEDLLVAASTSAPDLVLLDWNLTGLRPEDVFAALRARFPGTAVVVLSTRREPCARALAAGADAFVCKADAPKLLLATLQRLVPK